LLHWTDDTLYWVAKPAVHVEQAGAARRLHNDKGAAVESDVENLYFWHGVMVPSYAVTHPEWITVDEIEHETNAEVRRVLIERYGQQRYLLDAGAKEIHRDRFGVLYSKEIDGDEPLVMVRVLNSTPEPDGSLTRDEAMAAFGPDAATAEVDTETGEVSVRLLRESSSTVRFKDYFIRVPPATRTAHAAVAWSFDTPTRQYGPALQT
jgi:hypothetical protein